MHRARKRCFDDAAQVTSGTALHCTALCKKTIVPTPKGHETMYAAFFFIFQFQYSDALPSLSSAVERAAYPAKRWTNAVGPPSNALRAPHN